MSAAPRSRASHPSRASHQSCPSRQSRPLTPVSRVLRLCLHALFLGLLALAAGRAVTGSAPGAGWVVAVCAVLAAGYLAGALSPAVRNSPRAGALWLAGLGAAWAALLVLSPDGLWIAFPLYFLELHLLRLRWAIPAVAVTACAAIGGFLAHSGAVTPGPFLGPLLGGAVAVATVLGYEALYRESERRRELIEELITTRAELAAAERDAGILAERERLAREIHDTLAQGLSSIQLLLRAAERSLPQDAPALSHIARAREAAQENLAEARRFVRALTPPDLEHGSLPAALERLCSGVRGPRVRFSLSGTARVLPTPYEVALLRIAQSALANVVRHAAAGRAEITLTFMDASVTLDIVDDGQGFDPGSTRAGGEGGFGLPAMRSRAETLGGLFTVESAPGQGTAVAVTLPLAVEVS
ncbi:MULTISPECIES: sensor histidine kinase [unclassified Streptomyces]|uniref:sensor histidine kinase n=1 Tax=unclassified Streptomyces TaxID=2593676 RepID=UPI002254CD1C|nr:MULTISPECIES: sensor histidine kinase [unclassified Streptomyces]MCX4528835.1 sensor histidine kinase [Streptomyces sp. NBC_01551]MCX4540557.1 sensor histidine kinase [Streptomyces sp. NBC_01565]